MAPSLDFREQQQLSQLEQDLGTIANFAGNYSSIEDAVVAIRSGAIALPRERAVTLATVHYAKGREWPVVFVVDLTEGVLPHRRSTDVDEERRIFYVAITRASRRLYLFAPERVAGGGQAVSRFLRLLNAGAA